MYYQFTYLYYQTQDGIQGCFVQMLNGFFCVTYLILSVNTSGW